MANKYDCSDGTKVNQGQIDRNRSKAYQRRYAGTSVLCDSCGCQRATESSHIVSQARCKALHRADLIWDAENFFPACRSCHIRWEDKDTTLAGYDRYMEVVEKFDPEGHKKRINLRKETP